MLGCIWYGQVMKSQKRCIGTRQCYVILAACNEIHERTSALSLGSVWPGGCSFGSDQAMTVYVVIWMLQWCCMMKRSLNYWSMQSVPLNGFSSLTMFVLYRGI